MRKHWLVSFLFVVLIMNIPSCDDGGGDGDIFNSAPGDTPLDELTDEQVYDLCIELQQALDQNVSQEEYCMLYAIIAASEQDEISQELACELAYALCMDEEMGSLIECDDSEDMNDEVEDCDATVDEMDQCVQDWIDEWDSTTQGLDCSVEEVEEPEEPDSCAALPEECPDLTDLIIGDDYYY